MHPTIQALSIDLIERQKKRRAATATIAEVKTIISHIGKYADSFGLETDVKEILIEYISDEKQILSKGTFPKDNIHSIRIKVASRLLDIYDGKPICWHLTPSSGTKLTEYYQGILSQVREAIKYNYKDLQGILSAGRVFFGWLQDNHTDTLNGLSSEKVKEYLFAKAQRSTEHAKTVVIRLKVVISALVELKIVDSSCMHAFILPIKCHSKLLPPADPKVARDILEHIDRSKPNGKRDFAIILIAIVTGLRSVDIRKLKFSSLDYEKGEISLVQSKTGQLIRLPFTQDVADAIKDYVDHGRPESDDTTTIFLTSRSPYKALARGSISAIYYKKAIALGYRDDNALFHGLRRLRGVTLVSNGAPLPIVMQTLGHRVPSATEKYLSFDQENMKSCALSLKATYSTRSLA